ncbi:hypothetical protein SUGI_0821790 [Cryptomeria japonica]|nr:hypothetical protein SUGI_0821790 [Cryptomeria japonica]
MESTKSQLSVAFLVFYVLSLILLSNVGCECREVISSLDNANHSNFLRATYMSHNAKRKFWCGDDPNCCARAHKDEPGRWEWCDKKYCIDLDSNEYHCGNCGNSCGYGFSCCKGKCVDLMSDPNHCGSCFNQCDDKKKCEFGICGYCQGRAQSTHNQTGTLRT